MADIIRTDADEEVANGDLLTDEVTEDRATGDADGIDEPGEQIEQVEGAVVPEVPSHLRMPVDEEVPSLAGLRDAAEASFDVPLDLNRASVIGADDRRRISPADRYPWRVHCSLLITARDGSRWIGTAFFIGPRVLGTAGHNLFLNSPIPARRGWVRSIQVMPGRDGSSLPYGSSTSTRFYSVRGWTQGADPEYDYGAIVLSDRLGATTGWLGLGAYSDATLRSVVGNLSGYPGDLGNGTQQWYMARRIAAVSSRKVFYDIDTFGGQSGSAVYRITGGSRHVVGIHAYGTGGGPYNSATRVNRPVFDNLVTWKNRHT